MRDGTGWLTKPLMFVSSYAPLFIMLAIRFEDVWLRAGCALAAAVGLIALPTVMRLQEVGSPTEHSVTDVEPAGSGASSYLAGYLLPFLTVSSPTAADLIAYGVFLVVAFLVHMRTELIQVNPTLFLYGWRIFSITDANGLQTHLICKERILTGDRVMAYRMTDDVLVATTSR
ncbi:hypothetical protein DQ226_11615 [Dietzia maris]|uniref:Uncharacterized protein n=1 Tax=Dietzia maris TaxID=37915 RepID=A0A365P8Y5_9ACTN|nr:hypothetical protein DQ226_11615 [Dietzia maris]